MIFDPQKGLGFQTLQSHCGTTRRAFGLKLCMLIVHDKAFGASGLRFALRDLLHRENWGRKGYFSQK